MLPSIVELGALPDTLEPDTLIGRASFTLIWKTKFIWYMLHLLQCFRLVNRPGLAPGHVFMYHFGQRSDCLFSSLHISS